MQAWLSYNTNPPHFGAAFFNPESLLEKPTLSLSWLPGDTLRAHLESLKEDKAQLQFHLSRLGFAIVGSEGKEKMQL